MTGVTGRERSPALVLDTRAPVCSASSSLPRVWWWLCRRGAVVTGDFFLLLPPAFAPPLLPDVKNDVESFMLNARLSVVCCFCFVWRSPSEARAHALAARSFPFCARVIVAASTPTQFANPQRSSANGEEKQLVRNALLLLVCIADQKAPAAGPSYAHHHVASAALK